MKKKSKEINKKYSDELAPVPYDPLNRWEVITFTEYPKITIKEILDKYTEQGEINE